MGSPVPVVEPLRPAARSLPRAAAPSAEEPEDEEQEEGEEEEAEREEEEPVAVVPVGDDDRLSGVGRARPAADDDRVVTRPPVSVGAGADPDADAHEG